MIMLGERSLIGQQSFNIAAMFSLKSLFEKNANFFAENWQKIAETCDPNIDPMFELAAVTIPAT
jgi:hypothetical protein